MSAIPQSPCYTAIHVPSSTIVKSTPSHHAAATERLYLPLDSWLPRFPWFPWLSVLHIVSPCGPTRMTGLAHIKTR